MVYVDGDGEQLDGRHRYELRFTTAPPVGAFWSVTMYDTPDFYLVANPIDRYSIGDRTPGLRPRRRRLADHRHAARRAVRPRPPRELAARRPPRPSGRSCACTSPTPSVFDGSYELPPIDRVD